MCIVFRVLGSFLILDCHQSIGYPSGCMDDHKSHGVTPSERYPCMAAAHRVHLGNGRTVLGFGVWIQQREFVFSDFSDEASVFFFEWKNLMIFLGGNGMIGATNWRVEPHHAVKNQFLIPGALAADAFQHGNWGKYQYTFMNSALRHFWAAFFVLEHEHVSYVVKNPLGLGRLHGGLRFRFLGKDKNTTLELRSASGLRKLEWFTSGYCRPATLGRYQSDDLNFHVFDIFLQIVVIVI